MIKACNVLKQCLRLSLSNVQVRTLYSPITLGIDNYKQQRERTAKQLGGISEKFKEKMTDYVAPDVSSMIFTEDLKNMMHLAEEKDLDLTIKMLKKFNQQNKQMRFGTFVFGPVAMRLFHMLNKPKEALEAFTSPDLTGIWDQLMTYQILLDLLFENKMYNEILDAFKVIQERQIEGTKFPRNIVVLVMAACYKINTAESFQFAMKLWKEIQEAGHFPMRRAATFFCALAVNHKKNDVCLEVLSSVRNQNYVTIRNLKVLALCNLDRLDEAISILKSTLQEEMSTVKQTYCADVIEKVKEAVEKSDNLEQKQEIERIIQYFKEHQLISDVSLDNQLTSEIQPPAFVGKKQMGMEFRKPRFVRSNKFVKRPGLEDLN